jgi:hypothetical protein
VALTAGSMASRGHHPSSPAPNTSMSPAPAIDSDVVTVTDVGGDKGRKQEGMREDLLPCLFFSALVHAKIVWTLIILLVSLNKQLGECPRVAAELTRLFYFSLDYNVHSSTKQ